MKLTKFAVILSLLGLSLCACTSDDEPSFVGDINEDIFTAVIADKNLTYSLSHIDFYEKSPQTGDKWVTFNAEDYIGWSSGIKDEIVMWGGNAYIQPVKWRSSCGPHPVWSLWYIYKRAEGNLNNPIFYYKVPFKYDAKTKTLTIDKDYTVVSANDKNMSIYHDSSFLTSYNGETIKGVHRSKAYYTIEAPTVPDDKNVLFFDNCHDLYGHMLKLAHDKFGDTVDANTYLYPDVILDHPTIDIAELIENWENGRYDTDWWE